MKDYLYFCRMNRMCRIVLSVWWILAVGAGVGLQAQELNMRQKLLPVEVYKGDTIPVIHLREVYVYQRPKFRNKRHEKFYWRTVRDVKKIGRASCRERVSLCV